MLTTKTFCRICEAHCGLVVEHDDPVGSIKLRPDRTHPITKGFVCAKGLRFPEVIQHPDRLYTPQLRRPDGSLEHVSWEEALETAGSRLKAIINQYGSHAIGVYFGTTLIHNTLGMMTTFRFIRALGTRNFFSAGSLDNNNKFAAAQIIHGSEFIHPIMDLDHAELALLLGTNPLVSQGSFLRMEGGSTAYDRFIARGGRMIIIDPRRSESAERWGGHVAIRPGTDIFLLLTLLDQLRHQYTPDNRMHGLTDLLALASTYPVARASRLTDIPEATLINLAEQLQSASSTTFFMSVGVNQGPFGTLCSIALQALAVLTNNFDRQGGILFQPLGQYLKALLAPQSLPSRLGRYPASIGGLPCGILADEIRTPGPGQIRALIVIGGNPMAAAPDTLALRSAFEQLDLLISIDLFENQTGRLSHVLLPSTSWLERCDVAGWDSLVEHHPVLQVSPAIGVGCPFGEKRP